MFDKLSLHHILMLNYTLSRITLLHYFFKLYKRIQYFIMLHLRCSYCCLMFFFGGQEGARRWYTQCCASCRQHYRSSYLSEIGRCSQGGLAAPESTRINNIVGSGIMWEFVECFLSTWDLDLPPDDSTGQVKVVTCWTESILCCVHIWV